MFLFSFELSYKEIFPVCLVLVRKPVRFLTNSNKKQKLAIEQNGIFKNMNNCLGAHSIKDLP